MRFADFHTHTRFSDGRSPAEEMAAAAAEKGMYAIGFSDHAPMEFEEKYEKRQEWLDGIINCVAELRQSYEGRLEVFAGLEVDVNTDIDLTGLDYHLEGNHFIHVNGAYVPTDWTAEHIINGAAEHFGGDIYKFFSHYYEELSRAGDRGPAIVAHFDVVSKCNEGECFFSESDPRYLSAALSCIETLAKKDIVFEVNTGAVFRGYRTKPYPAIPLLRRMKELGCPIILGGDSHCMDALCHKFDEAIEYVALAGYKATDIERYPPMMK